MSNAKLSELDSFFDSKILIYFRDDSILKELVSDLKRIGFEYIFSTSNYNSFSQLIYNKFDLIIADITTDSNEENLEILEKIRIENNDVEIIAFSNNEIDQQKQLDLKLSECFTSPFSREILFKAVKKSIGNKINYEIGMQFFDALFGMQMCTHRDLHQRTFEHVIRTTKVYGKFLLYLIEKKIISLTSWSLKNCLMGSLVHDIGKLLVMHGVLYKDGKLSDFEFSQVKRHPWHSVTALLGGQDIEFFANSEGPIETVSGYNQKNLGTQAQRWIFKMFSSDLSAFNDVDDYFAEMSRKPFIHSLNRDLLYIVFRHHDGIYDSYHTADDLKSFSKIMGRKIKPELLEDSPLDLVTNALSLCDMYDALMDSKRDYRKTHYNKAFTLFLLYIEMREKKFFPTLLKAFIQFVVTHEKLEDDNPFKGIDDMEKVCFAIENVYGLFRITKDQEYLLNDFIIAQSESIRNYVINPTNEELRRLNDLWVEFSSQESRKLLDNFIGELKKAGLTKKNIDELNIDEIKTFDMLLKFYYSYSSPIKQKKLIDFLVDSVINFRLSSETRQILKFLLDDESVKTRKDIERIFIEHGYDRGDLYETFRNYDENILINELNDYLRRQGL